ncbi:hypothetical protein Tco_1371884, partial [Tanacetum coccineum]
SYMHNTILNVLPTSSALIPDLQHQLYMKMKTDPQSQAADSDVWNARKCDHDDHPNDDVLPEGENRAKNEKTSTMSKYA